MGRKLTKPRHRQGARLAALRTNAGLTQTELARLVGEKQQTIAYWERSSKPPRSDALPALARALGVSVEDLIGEKALPKVRAIPAPGPAGRVRKLFEEVSRLPRRQQDKVVEFVSAFIEQHKKRAS
jgi:transcriptional regulator with XRE-family HTH domain